MLQTLLDKHECSDGSHKCHQLAYCIEEEGSYNCSCNDGFQGDGYLCTGSVKF